MCKLDGTRLSCFVWTWTFVRFSSGVRDRGYMSSNHLRCSEGPVAVKMGDGEGASLGNIPLCAYLGRSMDTL